MQPEIKRGPGRPRKDVQPDHALAGAPDHIEVRMGAMPCATSKGVSAPGHNLHHGVAVSLPRDEADNLLNLGYVTRV